jgi:hypothetical protein
MDLVLTDDSEPDSPLKSADQRRQPTSAAVNLRHLPSPLSPFHNDSVSSPIRSAQRSPRKTAATHLPADNIMASPIRPPGTPKDANRSVVDFSSTEGISSILKSPLVAYQTVLASPVGQRGSARLTGTQVSPMAESKGRRRTALRSEASDISLVQSRAKSSTNSKQATPPQSLKKKSPKTVASPRISPRQSSVPLSPLDTRVRRSPASGTCTRASPSEACLKSPSPRLIPKKLLTASQLVVSSTKNKLENAASDYYQPASEEHETKKVLSGRADNSFSNSSRAKKSLTAEDMQSTGRELSSEESADSSNCWSIERFHQSPKTTGTEDRKTKKQANNEAYQVRLQGPAPCHSREDLSFQSEKNREFNAESSTVTTAAVAAAVVSTSVEPAPQQVQNDVVSRKKKRRNLGMSAENSTVTIQLYAESAVSGLDAKAMAIPEKNSTSTGVVTSVLLQPVVEASGGIKPVTTDDHIGPDAAGHFSRTATESSVDLPQVGTPEYSQDNGSAFGPDSSSSVTTKKKRKRLNMSNDCETVFSCSETTLSSEENSTKVGENVSLVNIKQMEMEGRAVENVGFPPAKKKRAKLSMSSDSHVTSIVSSR